MKNNKVKIYAKALSEVILDKKAAGPEQQRRTVNNFLALLAKNGDLGKAKEILKIAQDITLKKQGKRKIILETARKLTAGQKKLLDNFLKAGDIVEEKVNPELIAGIKIIINEEKQFDNSMLSKLNNIL